MEVISNFVSAALYFLLNLFLIALGSIIVIILGTKILSKTLFKQKLSKAINSKDKVFLLVKIPASNDQKEDAMENFFHSIQRVVSKNIHISFEMVSENQFLSFYIIAPKGLRNLIESQLYAQYPDLEIEEVNDYLESTNQNTEYVELKLKEGSFSLLATYDKLKEDLLKNLSAVLAKTDSGDRAFIQIVLRKVGSKFYERGFRYFLYKLSGGNKPENPSYEKLSQDLFAGKIRLGYQSNSKESAKSKLHTLVNFLKGVKGANSLKETRSFLFPDDLSKKFKARILENSDLFTMGELATLYHFPYKGNLVSNVVQTTSRRAPAPDILPFEGLVDPSEVSFFGETNYRNDKKMFGIKRIDRRRHLYIVGKTGSGKSKLLELLLISDLQNGEGCCLIDPHGDLADEVLKFVPKKRIEDVVYINPTDRDFPIGFNPLEPVDNYEERQHLSRFLISIFKKLFAENWNSRMEHLIRYITLALLETSDSSILGITRMLSDTNFRQRVIKQIQDPVVKSFWTNEFSTANEQFINVAAVPIINKVGQFVSNPIVRNMVGQQKNMLDFEKFMNEGKIVIINLSKGKLGEDNAALLGSMFITKIQQAALARAKIEEEKRKDFYFYVDEFQNFATDAFSTILSEARKYRLDLTIAHQYIAQLPEDVKATTFGNVGSLIVFPVGGDDAAYLAKEFTPIFIPDDMINLNVREMYIKMSVDGKLTQPFSAKTITVPKPEIDYSTEIIDRTRVKYGRNRVVVENEITRWSNALEVIGATSEEEFPEPII